MLGVLSADGKQNLRSPFRAGTRGAQLLGASQRPAGGYLSPAAIAAHPGRSRSPSGALRSKA
jgi:hypothetical protein